MHIHIGIITSCHRPKSGHSATAAFQVGCHKIFHTCVINTFKIDYLNGSPEHAFFVTTNLKTAVLDLLCVTHDMHDRSFRLSCCSNNLERLN